MLKFLEVFTRNKTYVCTTVCVCVCVCVYIYNVCIWLKTNIKQK